MKIKLHMIFLLLSLGMSIAFQSNAALSLDRTRLIFNGNEESVEVTVTNNDKKSPYLIHSWVENANGEKINEPLVALPPIQRIEAGNKTLIRLRGLANIQNLPQDRESLFFLNIREIPPKSNNKNALQFALQTRIKIFYRPENIVIRKSTLATPGTQNITISKEKNKFKIFNPTDYNINMVAIKNGNKMLHGFNPAVIPPKDNYELDIPNNIILQNPVISIVNDYGTSINISFLCKNNECNVEKINHKSN
ncbi:fimbria/pilus periplasmic chaperone [Providencia rettgeri]|uniref:fimbria/pilus periplasmic chaperone n=1 Tax=Providencia rettgeri TaxID=587 RepID=UPI00226EAF2C|nr:fimbria/pilus periplasmic chaperone [Providencia rettgeri]MCX9096503.1 fimbria/pilus periplasmic chaperone [Providencia rettgeri]